MQAQTRQRGKCTVRRSGALALWLLTLCLAGHALVATARAQSEVPPQSPQSGSASAPALPEGSQTAAPLTPPPPAPVVQAAPPAMPPAPPPSAPSPGAPRETVSEVDPIDIPPEHDPLAHAWDRPGDRGGFYLRGSITLGYHHAALGATDWQDGDGSEVDGFGTGFGLDLGYFVAPWLALHLDSTAGVLWNGDEDYDFYYAYANNEHARVVALGVAPAATFYTPGSFFLKTAFGLGYGHVKRPDNNANTNPGFYMNLVAGKDLFVSRNFAFGIQMQYSYMWLPADDRDDEARLNQILFGFSFAYDSI
jgi:hypothetical protein